MSPRSVANFSLQTAPVLFLICKMVPTYPSSTSRPAGAWYAAAAVVSPPTGLASPPWLATRPPWPSLGPTPPLFGAPSLLHTLPPMVLFPGERTATKRPFRCPCLASATSTREAQGQSPYEPPLPSISPSCHAPAIPPLGATLTVAPGFSLPPSISPDELIPSASQSLELPPSHLSP